MSYLGSHTSSSSRGVLVENKVCPKCNIRANIRSSGPTAANPFKLYYKCDACGWFQWCKTRNEEIVYDNTSEAQHLSYPQDLKKKMKEQAQTIDGIKEKLEDLCKLVHLSVKVALVLYLFLLYVVMKK
ncbi:hypothetical protein RND81_02G184700 [Saponaria officinalis]|uniref:Zinc finger GRF-type domain-containing protein n=1 Tax=Saponaria officinalis TaxID=3572 RepID=A0AAW1MUU6_SAPOF